MLLFLPLLSARWEPSATWLQRCWRGQLTWGTVSLPWSRWICTLWACSTGRPSWGALTFSQVGQTNERTKVLSELFWFFLPNYCQHKKELLLCAAQNMTVGRRNGIYWLNECFCRPSSCPTSRWVCARVPDGLPGGGRKPPHIWGYAGPGIQGEAAAQIPWGLEGEQFGRFESALLWLKINTGLVTFFVLFSIIGAMSWIYFCLFKKYCGLFLPSSDTYSADRKRNKVILKRTCFKSICRDHLISRSLFLVLWFWISLVHMSITISRHTFRWFIMNVCVYTMNEQRSVLYGVKLCFPQKLLLQR